MKVSAEVEAACAFAQSEAIRRRHDVMTVEHLLYGLLQDPATARAANAPALPFTEAVHKICPRCCERRESRARHAEEEGAEAFFPLRATTK